MLRVEFRYIYRYRFVLRLSLASRLQESHHPKALSIQCLSPSSLGCQLQPRTQCHSLHQQEPRRLARRLWSLGRAAHRPLRARADAEPRRHQCRCRWRAAHQSLRVRTNAEPRRHQCRCRWRAVHPSLQVRAKRSRSIRWVLLETQAGRRFPHRAYPQRRYYRHHRSETHHFRLLRVPQPGRCLRCLQSGTECRRRPRSPGRESLYSRSAKQGFDASDLIDPVPLMPSRHHDPPDNYTVQVMEPFSRAISQVGSKVEPPRWCRHAECHRHSSGSSDRLKKLSLIRAEA